MRDEGLLSAKLICYTYLLSAIYLLSAMHINIKHTREHAHTHTWAMANGNIIIVKSSTFELIDPFLRVCVAASSLKRKYD